MPSARRSVPFHKSIGLRVGVIVAVFVLVADLSSMPIWPGAKWLYPNWYSDEALADALEYYQATGRLFAPEERRTLIRESILFAIVLALIAWFIVARVATRKLSRLADAAAAPTDDGSLPGPFDTSGHDEIAVLAGSLNAMRARAVGSLERLSERDAARREWIAHVSHDLRTPVTALTLGLERVAALVEPDATPGEVHELLAAARIDVQRIGALTEDLLEIARLDAGDELVREPVPSGELALRTVEALLPIARDRDVELRSEIPPGLPILEADGRRLARALENLVVNSLRHARSSVVLSVAADDHVRFVVRDDGPGFATEGAVELDALRAGRSRADSAGLGLQVAQRVAAAHGGHIAARNRPAGGACVELSLPHPTRGE